MNLLLEGIKLCREANKEPQKSFLIVEMEKKHSDIHYTFTRLTKLKRACRTVLSGVTLNLAMEFLLGIFIGFFNYK